MLQGRPKERFKKYKIFYLIFFVLSVIPLLSYAQTDTGELKVALQASTISLDPGGIQDSQSWIISRPFYFALSSIAWLNNCWCCAKYSN